MPGKANVSAMSFPTVVWRGNDMAGVRFETVPSGYSGGVEQLACIYMPYIEMVNTRIVCSMAVTSSSLILFHDGRAETLDQTTLKRCPLTSSTTCQHFELCECRRQFRDAWGVGDPRENSMLVRST